ncbi:MAG: alanine transaminase [bacterium]
MFDFPRIKRLPPYVFNIVVDLKNKARRAGEDIIDLGMGNPDIPTPQHVVDKLVEAAYNPKNHRYSASKGITKLRVAISDWYKRNYDVHIDPETEAIVTIGAKEGLSHFALATLERGDVVLVPNPTYPIHTYCAVIAGADVHSIPFTPDRDFFVELEKSTKRVWPAPKLLLISFPHNPTTRVVDLSFFERVVDFAKENKLIVVHDFAYADLCFDGYHAPSMLQVPGAKDVGIEFYSLSKGYSMPGWRVAFAVGNSELINALARLKSYFDYGIFQPVQIASIIALNGPQDCVDNIRETYRVRRDVLVEGLNKIGWNVEKPKGTMFVWAEIPDEFKALGSIEFTKLLLKEGKVAVSPGIGFGEYGEGYVRFSLVENEHRIKQAIRGIKRVVSGR